jgi:hypothetical protein
VNAGLRRTKREASKGEQDLDKRSVKYMSKVVSINSKRFLGGYSAVKDNLPNSEDAIFLAGVASTMVIPVAVYCAQGGPVSPVVFAGVALTGALIGLIKYRLLPSDVITRVSVGNMPQSPSGDIPLKKAS